MGRVKVSASAPFKKFHTSRPPRLDQQTYTITKMSTSQKRKSESPVTDNDETTPSKRICRKTVANGSDAPPPDSHINHATAITYWSSTEPTVAGVLGGFPQVSRVDLQSSRNFIAKLRRQSAHHPPSKGKLKRAVDCGAGIGRITTGLLVDVAEVVDVVEPVKSFTDKVKDAEGVGSIYNVGLEAWFLDKDGLGPYDLIWNQWCVGQLTDAQLVAYLQRVQKVLNEGGWIVVKENLSNTGQDVFDADDSSVTRTDGKFRHLFEEAELRVVRSELQKGLPVEGLYPVRCYALQPRG